MSRQILADMLRELAEGKIQIDNPRLREILGKATEIAEPGGLDTADPAGSIASTMIKIYGREALTVAKLIEEQSDNREFAREVRLKVQAILGLN